MTSSKLIEYVSAEPFRPFRIKMASGEGFEIRHPEMILVGRNSVRVYRSPDENPDAPPQWRDVSMLLTESIEPMPASSAKSNN